MTVAALSPSDRLFAAETRAAPGPAQALVSAEAIGLRRHGRWLARDVSLTLRRGEILSLIGPNGAGKSTVARMLAGVVRPSTGRIERARGLSIGYVPQKLSIDPTLPLTVRGLFRLTGRLGPREITAALDRVSAAHLIDMPAQTLSGGEFQRVLLARAIARSPDLLILDEPVTGVDIGGEETLYRLIAATRDRLDCGVLLISHDLHVVMAQTDQVLCLNGHVCCSGTPTQVARSAPFRALFGQRGDGVVALYQHHHDHAHDADGAIVPLPPDRAAKRHDGGGDAG